ncbi:MAG: site-2 protease family protein [Spirochaetales bacterium]|nr:site-2 protease family protein [Spirochaetales bacterium]
MVLTIVFGIIGFGIMVFVHELGHFIAAKRVGIGVETFSLGWGRKIVGFDYKGTNYRISMLPFGGYCKLKGEDPYNAQEQREDGTFFAAPPWKRIVTSAAGPLANVLFAVLVLTLIWWVGFNVHTDGNRIVLASEYGVDILSRTPPATRAGLQTGDRIVAVDGQRINHFQDLLETVATAPNREIVLTVEREGRMLQAALTPELDLDTGAGKIGVYAWRDPIIDKVTPGSAASLAGLQRGDRVTSAGGKPVRHTIDFYQQLEGRPQTLEIGYQREGISREATLVLDYDERGIVNLGATFAVGVYPTQEVGIAGALAKGIEESWETFLITVKGIGLLFKGVNLRNAVAGPLRITYYVGSVATSGFGFGLAEGLVSYFRFLCLLSIVLFIINLLPIPGLDGGQILVFALESLRRRPLQPKVIARIQMISFSFIVLIAVVATFSDILFFMGR